MTASNLFNLALAIDLPILANHRLLANDIKNIIASILNIIFNVVVGFYYILTAYKVFALSTKRNELNVDNTNNNDDSTTTQQQQQQLDCNSTLYNFTFWFVCLSLGSFAVISLLGLVLYLYNSHRLAIIRGSTPRSHARQGEAATNNQQPNITPSAT